MSLLGNGEKNYDVVKIKKEQLIDPTFYDSSPSEKDNTMTVEVACAFDSMSMAAQEDGIDLKVTSGFRTYERQKYFWDCYQNCSCNNCSPAAQPGRSNHGYGYALDLNTDCDDSPNSPLSSCSSSLVYQWLQLNAAAFGFENTIISEPWHWVFGSRDNNN
jgi:D-alanyl-D-alanine carboxypeptidase